MSMLTPRGAGARRPGRTGRRRRVLPALLVAVLLVGAAGAGWWLLLRDDGRQGTDTAQDRARVSCPTPSPVPTPVAPARVTVNVYNATEQRGLAARVATDLRARRFKVAQVANDPLKRRVTGVAEVRSGTAGRAAARTVAAQVSAGGVVLVPDQRKDASVDLVVGARYRRLATPAQAAAALRPTPAPTPSGC